MLGSRHAFVVEFEASNGKALWAPLEENRNWTLQKRKGQELNTQEGVGCLMGWKFVMDGGKSKKWKGEESGYPEEF